LKAPVIHAGDGKRSFVWSLGMEETFDMVLRLYYNGTVQQEQPPIKMNTRYPQDVYEAIKRFAQEDGRSFHNMVIWILRDYIRRRQGKERAC